MSKISKRWNGWNPGAGTGVIFGILIVAALVVAFGNPIQSQDKPTSGSQALIDHGSGVFTTAEPMSVQDFGATLASFKATHPNLHVTAFGNDIVSYGSIGLWVVSCDSVRGQ